MKRRGRRVLDTHLGFGEGGQVAVVQILLHIAVIGKIEPGV